MNDDKNIKFIAYLEGKLSASERKELEEKFSEQEDLSDQFLATVLHNYEGHRQRMLMRKVINEGGSQKRNSRINSFKTIRWAAIIIILLIPTGLILKHYLQKTNTLINQEYAYYPSQNGVRGDIRSENEFEFELEKAFKSYADQNFTRAANQFESVLENCNPQIYNQVHLYAGISFLWTKETAGFTRAQKHFEEVLKSDNPYHQAAKWFLAIAYYEDGKTEQSQVLFKEIADDPKVFNSKKAKDVLEKYF